LSLFGKVFAVCRGVTAFHCAKLKNSAPIQRHVQSFEPSAARLGAVQNQPMFSAFQRRSGRLQILSSELGLQCQFSVDSTACSEC
jgi:hypothetical protein